MVRRQAGPITTQSDRIQRGILDPTQAEEEAHGAKNKAMRPTRLRGKYQLPYPTGGRKNRWDPKC